MTTITQVIVSSFIAVLIPVAGQADDGIILYGAAADNPQMTATTVDTHNEVETGDLSIVAATAGTPDNDPTGRTNPGSLIVSLDGPSTIDEADYDTIEGDEVYDHSGQLLGRVRYRVPNMLETEHLRVSLKGNIRIRLLDRDLRQALNMEQSDLYIRIEDHGELAKFVYKERF